MIENTNHSNEDKVHWARLAGGISVLTAVAYLLWLFAPLSGAIALTVGFAIGPLMSLASYAGARALVAQRRSATSELAGVTGIVAGAMFTSMVVVQQTMFTFWALARSKTSDPAALEHINAAYNATNSVQLGLDIAWDVFISLATVLFGLTLLRWRGWLAWFGVVGALIATTSYVNNLMAFPMPPADRGSIDLGPFMGGWSLVFGLILWVRFGRAGSYAAPSKV